MPRVTVAPHTPALAADFNAVSDQSVMRFATAAQRTAAIPAPTLGMMTFRDDAKVYETWDGAAWVSTRAAVCRMRQNADQAFGAGVETGLGFVLDFSTNGAIYSQPGNGVCRIATTGVYLITGNLTGSGGRFSFSLLNLARKLSSAVGAADFNASVAATIERVTAVPFDINASAYGFTAGTIKADGGGFRSGYEVARIGD